MKGLTMDLVGTSAIIRELMARPGQSRYLLASHMHVPPSVLGEQLQRLVDQGSLVASHAQGDNEPLFWAAEGTKASGL